MKTRRCIPSAFLILGIITAAAQSDPLPSYEVGEIPPQRIWYQAEGSELAFQLTASPLGDSPTITVSYDQSAGPEGFIEMDPESNIFRYRPAETDTESFLATFLAVGSGSPIVQQVEIEPIQPLPPEGIAFGTGPNAPLPDAEGRDYLTVHDISSHEKIPFNDSDAGGRQTRTVTIVGKTVVFEEGHPNGLYEKIHGSKNIVLLEIYAESLVLRDAVHLPQTHVRIHAVDLIFEDRGETLSTLSTTPLVPFGDATPPAAGEAGFLAESTRGHDAGDLDLFVKNIEAAGTAKRFLLNGGDGRKASPGKNGTAAGFIQAVPRNSVEYEGKGTLPDYTIAAWIEVSGIIKDRWAPSEKAYKDRRRWKTLKATDGPSSPGNAIPGGLPGRPGKGGDVTALFDVTALIDNSGGRQGEVAATAQGGTGVRVRSVNKRDFSRNGRILHGKVSVPVFGSPSYSTVDNYTISAPDGKDAPGPQHAEDQRHGALGEVVVQSENLRWLTPEALRPVLAYLNDAYMNGHFDFVQAQLEQHLQNIEDAAASRGWTELEDHTRTDLEQIADEMRTMRSRLHNNLDYFGNPAGWVPMLSFEVNYAAFKDEIDRALRIMYVNYWLGNKAETVQERQDALRALRKELLKTIEKDRAAFDDAVETIPGVRVHAEDLQNAIDALVLRIREIEEEVLKKAKRIVAAKKAARTLGRIAQMVPVYQPGLGALGGAVAASADIDPNKTWEENTLLVGEGAMGGFAAGKATDKAAAAQREMNKIDTSNPDLASDPAVQQALRDARGPLMELMQDTGGLLLEDKAADPEVRAEMERLLQEHSEFRVLEKELKDLHARKRDFAMQLADLMQTITVLPIAISRNLRAVEQLNRELAAEIDKLDPSTLAYLNDMNGRARARLLKYHYYVARAYSYRRLEAYPGALDLNAVFDKIAEFAATDTEEISPDHFATLEAVYEDQLATVAERILGDANQNPSERSVSVLFTLPDAVVDQINSGEVARINLKDLDLFPENEENLRITDLEVTTMELTPDPSSPMPNRYSLEFKHSGISELQRDGKNFYFRHYNENTRNAISWKSAYQFLNDTIENVRPSAASESLIGTLVDKSPRDILIYTRPAAHAELLIKSEINTPGARVTLHGATIRVHYDYTERSEFVKRIKIDPAAGSIAPEIAFETGDRNGRANGRGEFQRFFDKNSTVTLTAPKIVGDYEFVRWEGAPLLQSKSNTLTVTMTENMNLVPIYRSTAQYEITVVGGTGSGLYDSGRVVSIAAQVPSGYEFVRWEGGLAEDPFAASTTLPVLDDTRVTAVFAPDEGTVEEASLSIARLSGENSPGLELVLSGTPGATYLVESTADLMHWEFLTSATLDSASTRLVVTPDENAGALFYRAIRE